MRTEAFLALLEQRIDKIRAVLASKAKEYATDADRLHNFKLAAQLTRETPPEALRGMLVKHWCSIMDIVDGVKYNRPLSLAQVDEKIGDAVNYLILLEAILKETPAN